MGFIVKGGGGSGTGGTTDHNSLTNRNIDNQHTINAIQGLQTELDKKVSVTIGKDLSSNDYDDTAKNKVDNLNITQVVDLDEVKNASHTHANQNVLDKVGESTGGNFTYNGVEIGGSSNSAITAEQINNTPAGNITASNVQAAINELDTKKLSSVVNTGTNYNEVWGKTGFYESLISTGGPTKGWGINSSGMVIGTYLEMLTLYGPGTDATNQGRTYTRTRNDAWKKLAITDDITASNANFSFKTDNAYSFGTSDKRATQLYAATATINTSDRNAKKDITETQLGLDFINKLKPVEYKYKVRQNVVEQIQDGTQTIEITPAEINEKGEVIKKAKVQEIPVYKEVVKSLPGIRTHLGLIAQEVEECLDGRDIAIVTKDENGYGLRYEELIAPLIKAVQELSAEVAELRNNTGK